MPLFQNGLLLPGFFIGKLSCCTNNLHTFASEGYLPLNKIISREELASESRILVVDDSELTRIVIRQILDRHGFKNVEEAANGKQALEMVEVTMPHLVILDLAMPVMSGYEFCRAVRQIKSNSELPILVQTVMTSTEEKVRAFNAGASDYITKPTNEHELIARAFLHLEKGKVARELADYNSKSRQEIEEAKLTQELMFPSVMEISEAMQKYGVKVYGHFQCTTFLGGDFWGMRCLDDNRLGIYIVDFSGHGISAALNSFRIHTMMENLASYACDPGQYLTELNKAVSPLLSTGQYATMFYGTIDCEAGVLKYASAASTTPVLFNARKARSEMLEPTGYPLGVVHDAVYQSKSVAFDVFDMLLLYSDALIETEDSGGEVWSEEQVCEAVSRVVAESGKDDSGAVFNTVLSHFSEKFMKNLRDDFTLNLYQRLPRPEK